tara:strand:+ start:228 stop:374 length:147 start_codon:yes stop_codon:yes gene_type:complete
MNTFTILFKNGLEEWVTTEIQLSFHSVNLVATWFEEALGLRAKSISKH